MFEHRPPAQPASPAILTAQATQRLPRWVLLLLGLLYVAPGLIGRDAWKPVDGTSLGIMLELASGRADWWHPTLLGQSPGEAAWLPYWLGAWAIRALPFLDPVLASRVPLAGALSLSLVATWYSAFSLALQPWAQPLRFAFGGHAEPVAYARAIADTALLVLVACLGLAIMGHESSPHPYAMAATAVLLHVAADAQRAERSLSRLRLGLRWALATAALMASGYPGTGWALGLLALLPRALSAYAPAHAPAPHQWAWRIAAAMGLSLAYILVPWPHDALSEAPWRAVHLWATLKTAIWYAWPAWPLAMLGLWAWRRQWRSAHVMLPVLVTGVALGVAWSAAVPQRHMLLVLPALAPLAALAMPAISRATQALIDWLALLMFSLAGLVIGLYGLAMLSGWPGPAARAVQRLLPGLDIVPGVDTVLVGLFACTITGFWVWTVRWRTMRHHSDAIWKGLVLSAAGTTWCWALLMSLWLPALNHGMSFDPLAQQIKAAANDARCLGALKLPPALQAALLRAGVSFTIDPVQALECDLLATGERADLSQLTGDRWAPTASLWQIDQRAQNVQLFKRLSP